MVQELSGPWNTLEQVLSSRSTHITTSINDAVDSASDHLGEYLPGRQPPRVLSLLDLDDLPDGYDTSISPLHQALTTCRRLLATEVEDLCDGYKGCVE